jgi:hypothetical protein
VGLGGVLVSFGGVVVRLGRVLVGGFVIARFVVLGGGVVGFGGVLVMFCRFAVRFVCHGCVSFGFPQNNWTPC